MKKQVRLGLWESNSSSTHSLVLANENEYIGWQKGELYYCKWAYGYDGAKKGKFYTKDEVEAFATKKGYTLDSVLEDKDFVDFDNFGSDEYEWFDDEITTPSGDKVYAVGYYGYDG